MKKIKEISLNPSYDLHSYPMHSRFKSNNGGPSGPADSSYNRVVMQKVNKNFKTEEEEKEEELDKFVDNVNLLKEFSLTLPDSFIDKAAGIGKSGLMSIPVFGDAFAFTKFLYTIYKLRSASRKFTKKLSQLTQIELGDDFLEPEGAITSDSSLDNNLSEAVYRLSNLKEYPELDVTMVDIHRLKDKYFQLFRYCKDAIMEFIGFADVAIGQKGFFVNAGISLVTYSEFPDFLVGEYASFIDELMLKAEEKSEKEGNYFSNIIDFFKDAASKFISVPRKLMDFIGNIDILINPNKLERLASIHNALEIYDDVDTNKEKYDLGLDAETGTSYADFLNSLDINVSDIVPDGDILKLNPLQAEAKKMSFYLQEDYSLVELYEDEEDDEESVEEHVVMGVAAPIGKKADGSVETSSERNKRQKAANIYVKELRKLQEWKLKTSGRTK